MIGLLRLVPETLYLTVNYIDIYLSGNVISRQKLQLLGVACIMIAAYVHQKLRSSDTSLIIHISRIRFLTWNLLF